MIINGENLLLGRLASFAAKKALLGGEIIIVNSEKVVVSGKKPIVLRYYRAKIERGNVFKGPFVSRMPDQIVRRAVRGMLPYKKEKGRKAFKRVKCYIGVPKEYTNKKYENVEDAQIKSLSTPYYMKIGDISALLGKEKRW